MQSAQFRNQIIAGAQVKVIRVSEHERRAKFFDLRRRERLDRGLRANGREDGGEEVAMRGRECPRAGAVVTSSDCEIKHEGDYTGCPLFHWAFMAR